jgi:hypothetical protein
MWAEGDAHKISILKSIGRSPLVRPRRRYRIALRWMLRRWAVRFGVRWLSKLSKWGLSVL